MRNMFDDFMEELRRRQAEQSRRSGSPEPDGETTEDDTVTTNGNDSGDAGDTSDRNRKNDGPRPVFGGGSDGWTPRRRAMGSAEMPQLTIGRGWIIAGIALFVLLFVAIAGYIVVAIWTDAIWFQSVGYSSVFWTRFGSQLGFFALGTVVALGVVWLNLWLAGRIAPKGQLRRFSLDDLIERFSLDGNSGGRFGGGPFGSSGRRTNATPGEVVEVPDLSRPVSWGLVGLGTLISLGLGALITGGWNTIQLFLHRVPFAQNDPVFGKNIGFYIFELPFFRLVQSYANALLLTLIVLVGIRYLVAVISGASMPTAARLHLGIIVMLYLWSVALGYQLDRFELVHSSQSNIFSGVSFADANAKFLAFNVMTGVAAFAGCFVLVFAYTRWRIPLSATLFIWLAASVILGWAYPSIVQRFSVDPNQQTQESQYIKNNIDMTRLAFGLDTWSGSQYEPKPTVTKAAVAAETATMQNIRLWDYRPLGTTLDQMQAFRSYYSFADVDTDRYVFTDSATCAPAAPPCVRQVMIAGRDFDPGKYAASIKGDVSWVNLHISYTHGFGLAMVPVNEIAPGGVPNLLVKDLPPVSAAGAPKITEPRIYFGTQTSDYVIANAASQEFDYSSSSGAGEDAFTSWTGQTGIKLDTPLSKLLFAVRFGDLNLLISDQITGNSQLLFRRSIQDRVQAIAPFLRYDKDPYLVVTSSGRLVYIQDAFTTSADFPNANSYDPGDDSGKSGLAGDKFNYIRNSVKVVMDAYDGTMTFYVVDPSDPIIQAWQGVFPGLFRPLSDMSTDLRAHLRYPEDMFNAQTAMFEKYHVTDPVVFYKKSDIWLVPKNSSSTLGTSANPPEQLSLEAYYVQMRMPGQTDPEFLLLQPMALASRPNMIAWVAARNDPATYGQVRVFDFPASSVVYGPQQMEGLIASNPDFSRDITQWSQGGSQVVLGNLLVIPLQDSLLYIEPLYIVSTENPFPILRRVIVGTPTQVVWGATLDEALNQIYAGQGTTTPGGSPTPGTSGGSPSPSVTSSPSGTSAPTPLASLSTDAQELIAEANQHYQAAQRAYDNHDLGTYQKELEKVGQLLRQLETVLGTPAPSGH